MKTLQIQTMMMKTRTRINRTRCRFRPLALAAVGVLAAQGCSTTPEPESDRLSPAGEWVLASIEDEPISRAVPRSARTPIVRIDESGAVSGNAGVNRFTGSVRAADLAVGGFTLSPLATTRMAGTAEAMGFESRFLDALSRVDAYEARSNALFLMQDTRTLLSFDRIEPQD